MRMLLPQRGHERVLPSGQAAHAVVVTVTVIAGFFFSVLGLWAFFWPSSFYERIALFPPYNPHFLHDAGAFQIGLGATLLLALYWRDALLVALLGVGLGAALHAVAHVVDRHLGGAGVLTPLSSVSWPSSSLWPL
jgi:hypothetical protein